MPAGVFARGVTPYLPLNMSPEIERQIERVLILAGKPVMTRPVPVATVADALSDACKVDEGLCEQVSRYLKRYAIPADLTHLRAEVAVDSGDSAHVIPNQHGMKVDSSWMVSAEAYYQPSDYFLINLGGIAYDGRATPTGSMLSLGFEYAQLDIGYRDHWLSPFTDSSMLISTEAPTMPSITLSNYQPISFLGLSYQIYLAEMSKSNLIDYEDRYTSGRPRLAGLHLQAEPVSGYAFSVNRQLQYGGGERGSSSFSDFINALRDPGKYDNAGKFSSNKEFGNQQASLTSRMLFSGKRPFAVYFEYAGEDTSFRKRYRLGNVSLSMGVDVPRVWNRYDITYETTEWQNAWYVHHVYHDGMTNEGSVIGHWFGDQRRFNNAAGGMSHMLRLGWQAGKDNYFQAAYRTLKNESYTSVAYKRMQELALSCSFPWIGNAMGIELYAGRDIYGDGYMRLNTSINFGQDWLSIHPDTIASVADPNAAADLFVDMGTAYSYSIKSYTGPAKTVETPSLPSDHDASAHLGLGVRRPVSAHNDIGTRIEWERFLGYDLLSVRLMDYRYRIGDRLAINGFFGVSRYNVATQPYSYYLGAGSQLINIMPRWDLCIDWRKSINMEQDYTIRAVALYLSRRF